MIELTIDSTAFATTPIPLSEPCRVVATHAGRKQFDCQGSEIKPILAPGKPDLFRSNPLAGPLGV